MSYIFTRRDQLVVPLNPEYLLEGVRQLVFGEGLPVLGVVHRHIAPLVDHPLRLDRVLCPSSLLSEP